MQRRVLRASGLVLVLVAGCAAEPPPTGSARQEVRQAGADPLAGMTFNAMNFNAMNFNAMNFNAMNFNAMNFNAMNFNAMNFNAMNFNAMNFNAMNFNAMNFNAMNFNGYVTSRRDLVGELATDPLFVQFMRYFVQCAAAEDEVIVFATSEQAKALAYGKEVVPSGGFPMAFVGKLGLAPEWLAGECDGPCQQAITACLEAHGNALGVMALISLAHPGRLERDACEADLARRFEAVYYGDVFREDTAALGADVDLTVGTPPPGSDPIAGAPIGVAARACLPVGECAIDRVGWARLPQGQTCGGYSKKKITQPGGQVIFHIQQELNACTDSDATTCFDAGYCGAPSSGAEKFREIMWVFRPNRTVDIQWPRNTVKHYDFQTGAAIPEAATVCLSKLRADPAMAHCFAADYQRTACDDPTTFGKPTRPRLYDKTCVRWTLEHCGSDEHPSLLEEGPPIGMGLSDCVDAVAGLRPSCSRPDGWWDAECVEIAENKCKPGPFLLCDSECSAGDTECSPDGRIRTCGDHDTDACLEWSSWHSCGAGAACSPATGSCEPTCTDECAGGSSRCVDGDTEETCSDADGDGCTEWTQSDCGLGEVCAADSCGPATVTPTIPTIPTPPPCGLTCM